MSANGNGFVGLVARMRAAQKHWFKYKNTASLEEAKKLEREVDRWIERETGPKATPTLFDGPEGGE